MAAITEHLPVIVSFLVAFVASFSRLFAASKPFWSKFPGWLQVLAPQIALAAGALATGLADGVNSFTDLAVVFVAAGALLLPGLPSNRSSAPLPGSSNDGGRPKPPSMYGSGLALAICGVLALSSCSLFGSGGAFWPVVAKCAPSPAVLVSEVEGILLAGGDYEKALKDLALKEGASVVECAVAAAVDALTGKLGASPGSEPAAARGKTFLASKGFSAE